MSADRYIGAVEASDWCTRHAILTPLVSGPAANEVVATSE